MSKPERDEGDQAYKRVVNTFSFKDKAVVRRRYSWRKSGEWLNDRFGGWQHDVLIVTANHCFWLTGVHTPPYPGWDDFQTGWTRADKLFHEALIELKTGESAIVASSNVDRLWKTTQPEVAWESYAGDERGRLISIKNGQSIEIGGFEFHPDYRDDDVFVDRLSDWGLDEKWLYRCKVYNFEVEDFHTYYVGNLGAWVHDNKIDS